MKQKLLIASMILALTFVGCGASSEADQTSDTSSTEAVTSQPEVAEDTVEDTTEESEEGVEAVCEPKGKYSAEFTEEIGGEDVTYEISYTFNSDGTGVYDGQDTLDFTWDACYIYMNDSKYPFDVNGDYISVTVDEVTQDYYQQ